MPSLLNVTKKILMLFIVVATVTGRNQILSCTGWVKPSLIWNVVHWYKRCTWMDAKVVDKDVKLPRKERQTSSKPLKRIFLKCGWPEPCSVKKGYEAIFDSSVGRSTVNHPPSGRYQITPTEASATQSTSPTWRDNNCICHGARIQPLCSRMVTHNHSCHASSSHSSVWLLLVQTGLGSVSYQELLQRMDK